MIFQLNPDDVAFPNPELAEPDGLLAVGGDLSVWRLVNAYANGIFPWPEEGSPLLWWSLDPRMVLRPKDFRYSKSLRRTVCHGGWEVRVDSCFEAVMRACAATEREGQEGTWITEEMVQAYVALHREGFAHSFETFRDGQLVGGLYGVSVGDFFFGESMFHRVTDASKVAFVRLVQFAAMHGFHLIDAQQQTKHLASLGAVPIPRKQFLQELRQIVPAHTVRRRWAGNCVALLLGSNMGDRRQLLQEALIEIERQVGYLSRRSKLYETAPWGFAADSPFLNMAAVALTDSSAEEVLAAVLAIEQQLGRRRMQDPLLHPVRPQDKSDYASRPIDIDIIFFNGDVIDRPALQVPHPRMAARRFVLRPLCDIMPDYVHPVIGQTMTKLLESCPDQGEIACVPDLWEG